MSTSPGLLGTLILIGVLALVALLLLDGGRNDGSERRSEQSPRQEPLVLPDRPLDLAAAKDGGRFPPQEPVEAKEGEAIRSGSSVPRLQMIDEKKRTMTIPFGAVGERVVLWIRVFDEQQGRRGHGEFALWHPSTGKRQPVPGWRKDLDDGESRILGTTGEWIVMLNRESPQAREQELVLLNVQNGETRTIFELGLGAGIGVPSFSDGAIEWADTVPVPEGGRRQRIHVYDTASDRRATIVDVPYEQQHFTFSSGKIGGHTIAWPNGMGSGGPNELFVADLRTSTLTRYQIEPDYFLSIQGVSDDGRYLLWADSFEKQFATDL